MIRHILLLSLIAHLQIYSDTLPFLITFYTPSHEVLYQKYFLPSFYASKLDKKYQLQVAKFEQECNQASYMANGWNNTMMRKVDLILETIKNNYGQTFVYADTDIQFFRSFNPKTYLKEQDIVFQRNQKNSKRVCAGFFIAIANQNVYNLWQNVKEQMIQNPKLDDQEPLNRALNNPEVVIDWGLLPSMFFNPALYTGAARWKPGIQLELPSKIILHHANWTVGLENKIAQLDYIKELLGLI